MIDLEPPQREYNVLVLGIERKDLPIPTESMRTRNFSVSFEKYKTPRRLQEYDGVIMFQGIFERFERKVGAMGSYLVHSFNADELDKRKKEAALLCSKGGFLCFLLTEAFIDGDGNRDFRATDLTKCELNYSGLYREKLPGRFTHICPVFGEFKRFLELFGAACSHFANTNKSLDCRVLATVNGRSVGLVLDRSVYFVPSLVPDPRPEVISEYFHLLLDAITSLHNKLHQSVPEWVTTYRFPEERLLLQERAELSNRVTAIDQRLTQLNGYKASLILSGQELVAKVVAILEAALGLKVDAGDDLREDIKLLDDNGKVVAVGEIKGINRGVKREHINQTDSHRERSSFDANCPAILIANTNIKSARSIAEKDQEIASEQVKHAVHMKVLVIRTIDLLGLLRLVLASKLTMHDARSLVLSSVGWLRVQLDEVRVILGNGDDGGRNLEVNRDEPDGSQ